MKLTFKNSQNGVNAYAGKIRVGSYFHNIVRQADGKLRVSSALLETVGIKLSSNYANTDEEAKEILQKGFDEFMEKLNFI